MFWKFGFAANSSIDTILDRPNVSLEDILDEDDLLQECKSQNTKLISFLQQPRILKRLLEHVVGDADVGGGQGPEWEEKVKFKYPYIASEVLSCDIWAIAEGLLADPKGLLEPFWDVILTYDADSPSAPTPHHSHPLFAASFKLPAHLDESASVPTSTPHASLGRTASDSAEPGPGKSVLAGYWAKVNGFLLDKKASEMLEFIKSLPMITERFAAHIETPAVIDLLYRIIQCEDTSPSAGIIDWLADHHLVLLLVDLLSPSHSPNIHNNTSELLKAVIALSAPSPSTLAQNADPSAPGFDSSMSSATGVANNRIVRDLAGEDVVRKMVTFMLDSADSAVDEPQIPSSETPAPVRASSTEEEAPMPLNPRDSPASESRVLEPTDPRRSPRPSPDSHRQDKSKAKAPEVAITQETRTSSLVTCISIFIELIRKNNSDYFEQHLFHTLRSHLLQRQQELSEQRTNKVSRVLEQSGTQEPPPDMNEEDDEMEGMEEAMAEVSEKLGIVHLGPMLGIISERLPDFQKLLTQPSESTAKLAMTIGPITPLSFERYRITELYAELLHCSNMALLNRAPGSGPQYSKQGTLMGGIDGLQVLAKALQGLDGNDGDDDASSTGVGHGQDPSGPVSMHQSSTPLEQGTEASKDAEADAPMRRSRHLREESKVGTSDSGEFMGDESTDTADASFTAVTGENSSFTLGIVDASPPSADDDTTAEVTDGVIQLSLHQRAQHLSNGAVHIEAPNESDLFVGELLKKRFHECSVIPSILQLFFDHHWNNFLHNVVYDILQQFFNGRMNGGYNERLTISVFAEGELCKRIIEGHHANEESANGPRKIRLGYMGHLNLIAEETVKLLERYPQEIAKAVESTMPQPEWHELLQTLQINRQKESGPLAGGRPSIGASITGIGFVTNGETAGSAEENTFASYLSSQIGNQSDDDDSDEDSGWIGARVGRSGHADAEGFDDSFQPIAHTGGDNDFDDDWGPFAGSSDPPTAESSNPFAQNLTSADWAAQFHREASSAAFDDPDAQANSDSASPSSRDNDDPFVDFFDPEFRNKDLIISPPAGNVVAERARRRSSASSGSSDPSAAQAVHAEEPFGPGVNATKTETTDDGRLVRTIDDGVGGQIQVAVPLDDVALAVASEAAQREDASIPKPAAEDGESAKAASSEDIALS
ncbi:SAPS-domain-containing protein [Tilletiaria anomala UBC 951]|uniref:SAPS-domain-containing protein n=1 Tax=Tilletiaria anomala (strain ATCC 24038 / CBS 436.72 / UBC 951) TaxID=1037660 RepID=A0A066WJP8_TILAU|nr:SAPS-domain-containing protein [Tilletiaria anomala UBC 951]KDN50850.1 SAPS-domain-containing protein [Tilletiaria anomala UBC 951]